MYKSLLSILILLIATFLTTNANAAAKTAYGQLIEGDRLYAKITQKGNNYTLESISPTEGNVLLNDLSPTFNTAERRCGTYFVTGKPVDAAARACEELKTSEFLKISIDTVTNVFRTAFSLGINVVAGGQHSRSGKFDEDEFKKALEQVFEKGPVNRKELIENYNYFKSQESDVSLTYQSNINKLKIKLNIHDSTGFFKNIDLSSYVLNHIITPPGTSINKMSFYEFLSFFERNNVDRYIAKKYATIVFNGYNASDSGFNFSLEPSVADNKEASFINVNANINDKTFVNIYPRFTNEDNYIKVDFDNNHNLHFTNNTDKFVQILSVSLYYGGYIKTLSLTDSPIELAPLATTLDPIYLSKFEDGKMRALATYEALTASTAKTTTLKFGFAVKYRVVEQNMDKTLFKLNKYNLYDLVTSEYSTAPALSENSKPFKPLAKTAKKR